MVALLGRAAQSVYWIFSLCLFVMLVMFNFNFEGDTLVLIAPVPDHCYLLTLYDVSNSYIEYLVSATIQCRSVSKAPRGIGYPCRPLFYYIRVGFEGLKGMMHLKKHLVILFEGDVPNSASDGVHFSTYLHRYGVW